MTLHRIHSAILRHAPGTLRPHLGWGAVGGSVMMLLALAAGIASGTNDRDACPQPFIVAGHTQPDQHTRCILRGDATLAATLLIDTSQLTLDCQGHTLRPAQPGSPRHNILYAGGACTRSCPGEVVFRSTGWPSGPSHCD
jgi:hypothetical protein